MRGQRTHTESPRASACFDRIALGGALARREGRRDLDEDAHEEVAALAAGSARGAILLDLTPSGKRFAVRVWGCTALGAYSHDAHSSREDCRHDI